MQRIALLLLAATAAALAQSNVAILTGIVTDTSGAVIPAAELTISNERTGIVTRVQTNQAGVYSAPSLDSGRYSVEIGAAGFKSHRVQNLLIETGERRRLDVTLDVGTLAEVVEVQATATPLMQESAEISETISSSEMQQLPLTSRSPYQLMVLAAGVSARGGDPSSLAYDSQVSINGSRAQGTAYVVDGASTTHIGGIGERIGSIEAIHEFRILSSTYSAEFGRTSGGVVSFQVKSGTTEYHGVLYEYHRNNALNANNWENNARGIAPATLLRNEFGGTLGGPVPGMNKKMFFFGSYEGLRDRIPVNRTRTIPDPAIRAGNFSGMPVRINDPSNGQPFPNNIVPQSRLDPAAIKFLQLFPQPNTQGSFNPTFGIHTNNWTRPGPQNDGKNFGVGRIDYNPTDKDKLFGTFSHVNEGPRDLVIDFDNALNTTIGPRFRDIRRITIGYTRVMRPNLTNEFLASAQRDPRKIAPWFPDFDARRELGIQRVAAPGMPRIDIQGGFGAYGNTQVQDWVHQPSSLSNITSWLRGRHSLRFGAQLYQNQFWYVSSPHVSGEYAFSGEVTGLGAPGRNNPVNALADLQLGLVNTAQIPIAQIPVNRVNYNLGMFFNDDWKVTNKLTLNLGLRYEFETRQIVKNNVYSRVDLNNGNLLIAGQNASRNLNLQNDWVNFSPRLGIAYSLDPKTVIRSGFAVFHANFWVDNGEMVAYPGWTGTQVFVDQGLGRAQPFRFSEGFPVEIVPPVTNPSELYAGATTARPLPVGAVTYNDNDRLPYNIQWNLSVQRQVGFNTVLDVAYVASRSVNLARTIAANNPRLELAPRVVIDRAPIQQVRPFNNLSGFNAVFYDAMSWYNSLQVKATRRYSNGFSLDGNYTFSKNLDTASRFADSFQIPWQFANIEKGFSSLDRTHVFTVGSVYELPFGKGKRYASSGLASAILGGFQLNGIYSVSSGIPLTITQVNTNLILASQRPDVRNPANLSGRLDSPVYQGSARRWLVAPNSPDFPFMGSNQLGFGNLGRNTSRGPGFTNLNFSIFRYLSITERVKLALRAEAFNALNKVNFNDPASTNINNANYGLSTGAAPARNVQIGARLQF
ncbi:MAG: carboxypeptidase regulatory-like domain-containing protein [Bryobacteraceae bacterium]